MKFRFKPEDFLDLRPGAGYRISIEESAQRANVLLEAHEKTLPRMWKNSCTKRWHEESAQGFDYPDTHTALLYGIEELKK